jgi:hypothetical protein
MKKNKLMKLLAVAVLAPGFAANAVESIAPVAAPDLVFDEVDGIVAVEAEHFCKQTLTDKRAWHITSSKAVPDIKPDADPPHVAGASGGAYLEILPDTRATHGHKLIKGGNFTDQPGQLAVIHYKVNINTPGRYYVWVRSCSTGSEDNGVHVGLNGQWPESGRRWQTVQKNKWAWDCKQRTPQVHTGVPMQLFLDIGKPGEHEIMFSMREDGFEMDKFVLAANKEFKPEGKGPAVKIKSGKLPAAFPEVAGAAIPAAAAAITVGAAEDDATNQAAAKVMPAAKTEAIASDPKPATPQEPLVMPRGADGKGTVEISGDLEEWHKVTLTLDGPYAHERDNEPNPFTDLALTVRFTHQSGAPSYTIPGYFAADGNAGESSAESGTKWRAHLSPDKAGIWNYAVSFTRGKHAALDGGGATVQPFDGASGSFEIMKTEKQGRDFRAHGRLQYVGKHHLQFAGSKNYFLKAGPDAPETLMAFADFDNTQATRKNAPLKTWEPHLKDWRQGDPTWKNGKGKGLIGALNYLADKGCNAFSFLTYNVDGDGDNVWPFVARRAKFHYDCSKLDQWGIVFDHATAKGLYLHFKLQENEMDDNRLGAERRDGTVPASLDGGRLGPERKLYCRELIARYAHNLALNWNIGEENTQSSEEIRDMVKFLRDSDPYQHHIVLHTFPPQQDEVYNPLLGDKSLLTGVSLQNPWRTTHQRTLQWLRESAAAGRPWVVANDEQNPAGLGVPPDPGYKGHDGIAAEKQPKGSKAEGNFVSKPYTLHDIRKATLWGNLMAGGAGVEYYFGYQLPENDLLCEDFRSREKSWDYCRIALDFFRDNRMPFWEMKNANALVGNTKNDNSRFCFAKAGELYLVYLPNGGETHIDLAGASGRFGVKWFNPREGGVPTATGSAALNGGGKRTLAAPSADDWLAVIAKEAAAGE